MMVFYLITDLHQWNAWLCVPFGFLLNFALLWLILLRTPKEMRVHSRVLLQTCALDICFLVFLTVGSILPFNLDGGNGIVLSNGYLIKLIQEQFGPTGLFVHYSISNAFAFLDMISSYAQFVCRYLVLVRDLKLTVPRYLLILSPGLIILAYLQINSQLGVKLSYATIDKEFMGDLIDWDDPRQAYFTLQEREYLTNWLLYILSLPLPIIQILLYGTIGFCAFKMVRFMNARAKESSFQNSRLISLNRQLTKTLILLASLPLFVILMTFIFNIILICNFMSKTYRTAALLQFCQFTLLSWFPLLNALISILTNRPYRDSFFCRHYRIKIILLLKQKIDALNPNRVVPLNG